MYIADAAGGSFLSPWSAASATTDALSFDVQAMIISEEWTSCKAGSNGNMQLMHNVLILY